MEESAKEQLLEQINALQALRGGIPTFILAEEIGARSIVRTRIALQGVPHGKELDVVLHSPGGDPHDAYRLIRSFRQRFDVVNIIVPTWAKSAATLLAFGGTRIVLHEYGELGPLDAQVRKSEDGVDAGLSSALNIQASLQAIEDRSRTGAIEMAQALHEANLKIGRTQLMEMVLAHTAKFYQPLMERIDAIEIGSMARYLEVGKLYAKRILTEYSDVKEPQLSELLTFLVYGSPDHGYVVDYGLLHPYMDTVILASQEPFGEDYYELLDRVSYSLMYERPGIVGFVNDLIPKDKKDDKIESEQQETNQNAPDATSPRGKAKRANTKSSPSRGSGTGKTVARKKRAATKPRTRRTTA